ncbi:MAG: polyprenyl diphosphate synthase [Candidatus Margulisiibacteriota bacterium]
MAPSVVPKHVAIIMDGNGRWAQQKGLPRTLGHKQGIKVLKQTIKDVYSLGIEFLSVYVFSTENWKRPEVEVNFLMKTLDSLLVKEVTELHQRGVQVRFLGELEKLSPSLRKKIDWAENLTRENTSLRLNLMVNYGGRQEILRAFSQMIANAETSFTEEKFSHYLYTRDCPDPDLVIRTGGDLRLSNFMLWQSAYSELWVTPHCWPEFNKQLLLKAIEDFNARDRKYGGLNA